MNTICVTGRLAADPEVRYTDDGKAICNFRLAVDRAGNTYDEAGFFAVVVFGQQAESSANYLTKGRKVGVEGRLRQRTWTKDGQQRSVVEIAASYVDFLDKPPQQEEQA